MRCGSVPAALILLAGLGSAAAQESDGGAPQPPPQSSGELSPEQLFETHCGACHSLELPRSQRLDRNNWEWVVEDMVTRFGATWITPEQQDIIIDYLVENYGRDRPR